MAMKKDFIFTPALLVVSILLFMLAVTGMTAHIVISIIGVVGLVAYSILTKKNWKIPALEIATRVCYGIALVTGIIVLNLDPSLNGFALAIIHKVFAGLFTAGLIGLFVHKLILSRKG